MAEALIIDAFRTPRGIGKAGKGALSDIHPQQLGATVLRALAERNKLNTAEVDDIIWGTSAQVGPQRGDMGRMSALDAGYDIRASGVTLDRFCGSGITAVNMAAASIMAGAEDLVIAGGTEKMSMQTRRGDGPMMMDSGNLRLRARHPQSHQGVCADAVATLEGISREDADKLALTSQQRAANAIENGHFKQERRAGLSRGRQPGARPRGISAAADHARRPGRAEAGVPAGRRLPARRQGHDLPQADPRRNIPISRSSTSTMPATRRAWSTARRRCCWPRRPTPRPRPEAARPASWRWPTWATRRR